MAQGSARIITGSYCSMEENYQQVIHQPQFWQTQTDEPLEKWALSLQGFKLTSITCNWLYTNLYGCRTLAYWAEKDNTPTDPAKILWKESCLACKKMSFAQQRLDTKLLNN